MLVPIILVLGAGAAAYELWWKPAHPSKPSGAAVPSAPKPGAAPLTLSKVVTQAKQTVQTVIGSPVTPGAAAAAQSSVVQSAPGPAMLSDPVAAAASLAANSLLHGAATDPTVQLVVKAFQSAVGLKADGKYGPQTQAKLRLYVPGAPAAPAVYGGTG